MILRRPGNFTLSSRLFGLTNLRPRRFRAVIEFEEDFFQFRERLRLSSAIFSVGHDLFLRPECNRKSQTGRESSREILPNDSEDTGWAEAFSDEAAEKAVEVIKITSSSGRSSRRNINVTRKRRLSSRRKHHKAFKSVQGRQ